MYEYLIWVMLLGIIWAFVYFLLPQLRQKMLWSGLVAFPFGFGELYFIPNYWVPQTLFDLGIKYHIDIEAFALMFFLGSLAGAIYEVLLGVLPRKQRFCHPICRCYLSLVFALVLFVVLVKFFPQWNIIYPASIACLGGGAMAMLFYPKLRKHVLLGGILFMSLYFVSLASMNLFFPAWIVSTWNIATLSKIFIMGVPVEEILFGFSFGTLWTPLFEEICSNVHNRR